MIQILSPHFVTLLDEIAQHFRVQEQKHFEEYNVTKPDMYENHDFLKYIDLAIALAETHIKLDQEVAIKLMLIPKYTNYVGCNYADEEIDPDNCWEYDSIQKILNLGKFNYEDYSDFKFILRKYEYQN